MKFENIQADREIKKMQEDVHNLLKDCEYNMYIAKEVESLFGILDYPYRLISTDKLVNGNKQPNLKAINNIYRSKKIILDSGGTHDWVNNEMILKVANRLRPTYIVPKDFPGRDKETIESVKEFFEIKDSWLTYEPEKILIPLQTPYRIVDYFKNKSNYFAIGGVVSTGQDRKKRLIETIVRKYPDKYFHLLGVSPMAMPGLIKRNKNVISSDLAIARKVIFSGEIAMGTYSRLPERYYYVYFILNELVKFYNYKLKKDSQRSLFAYTE